MHKWDVKSDSAFVLQFFLLISDNLGGAIIGHSRFEAALVYKPRVVSLKNEEFPFLVKKLSAI